MKQEKEREFAETTVDRQTVGDWSSGWGGEVELCSGNGRGQNFV